MKVSGNAFGGQTILSGERNTKKVEGFNLGNSPLEYTAEVVSGNRLSFTRLMVRKQLSKQNFLKIFSSAVLTIFRLSPKHLLALNKDVEIICAGSNGNFNLEDAVCAGRLISEMDKESYRS